MDQPVTNKETDTLKAAMKNLAETQQFQFSGWWSAAGNRFAHCERHDHSVCPALCRLKYSWMRLLWIRSRADWMQDEEWNHNLWSLICLNIRWPRFTLVYKNASITTFSRSLPCASKTKTDSKEPTRIVLSNQSPSLASIWLTNQIQWQESVIRRKWIKKHK